MKHKEAGFYPYGKRMMRMWDGEAWTDEYAANITRDDSVLFVLIMLGVAAGIVLGWFLVWVGAQISPDHIYWPVKFTIKDLPSLGINGY